MKSILIVASILAGALSACNTSTTDNTILEPTRDQRIDSLAIATCSRYQACNGYGTATGQKYADQQACRTDYTTKAATAWPIEQCGNGRINNAAFVSCEESTKQVACTGDAWDGVVAYGACTAAKVCTDAPH